MTEDLQNSYDRVAKDYAENFRDELAHKPFDRKMLDWLIEKVGDAGIICDMGCGPGQIAGYLSARGAKTCGIDLSPEMIEEARKLNPEIEFEQGNMTDLVNVPDDSFGGIAAFYSIIHVSRTEIVQAFKELNRTLRPNGVLLLAFHIGQQTIHRDEWWDKKVSIDFNFFETAEINNQLTLARFDLQEIIEREPYAEVEYPSRRAYIFAGKN